MWGIVKLKSIKSMFYMIKIIENGGGRSLHRTRILHNYLKNREFTGKFYVFEQTIDFSPVHPHVFNGFFIEFPKNLTGKSIQLSEKTSTKSIHNTFD